MLWMINNVWCTLFYFDIINNVFRNVKRFFVCVSNHKYECVLIVNMDLCCEIIFFGLINNLCSLPRLWNSCRKVQVLYRPVDIAGFAWTIICIMKVMSMLSRWTSLKRALQLIVREPYNLCWMILYYIYF